MSRRACLSAFLGVTAFAFAEEPASPSLADEQIRSAEFLEHLSIPNAGELFAAFGKIGKPDWAALFRKQSPASITSRPLIALNLGTLIADGFLAAEAQDRQQVKNVSREIKLLAKSIGLEQEFMVRSNSIADFADSRQWEALDEELEAVQSELALAMGGQRDHELATLMSLGCWLRSLEIASAYLAANYTPEGAEILRQPSVGEFFAAHLDALPAKVRSLPAVSELQQRLPALGLALSRPPGVPASSHSIAVLHTLTTAMVQIITTEAK